MIKNDAGQPMGRGRRPDIEGWLSAARRQGRCASLRDGLRPPLTPTIAEQIGLVIGRRQDPGRVTNRGTYAVESTRVNHNHRCLDYRSDKALCSIAFGLMRFQRVGGSIPSRRTYVMSQDIGNTSNPYGGYFRGLRTPRGW
jgi:hypothetical protein